MNRKFLSILVILNLMATTSIAWLLCKKGSYESGSLEFALEEIAEKKPHFLVSLLNKSANAIVKKEEKSLEQQAFQMRSQILKAGFCIMNHSDNNLVVFADMADANSLAYLNNVKKALAGLKCGVYIIPIALFGEKSTAQAALIWAAALQNPQKALQLALTYNPIEDATNDSMKEAAKLELNTKKLTSDSNLDALRQQIFDKTKLAETLGVGAPAIFLFKEGHAYILPPTEANDIPKLIEHPASS